MTYFRGSKKNTYANKSVDVWFSRVNAYSKSEADPSSTAVPASAILITSVSGGWKRLSPAGINAAGPVTVAAKLKRWKETATEMALGAEPSKLRESCGES